MRWRPRFSLRWLFVAIGVVAILLGVIRGSLRIIETEFWRVHPSEQAIADHIRQVGGAYHTDAKNGRHITGVWFQDTGATDRDVDVVMQLQYLKYLDLANSRVTDASLDKIFSHKSIRVLRVAGSRISTNALTAVICKAGDRLIMDE